MTKTMTVEEGIAWAEGNLAEIEQEAGVPLPQHMKDRYIAKIKHLLDTPAEELFEELLAKAATSGQQ
jgi:hypothetical protein